MYFADMAEASIIDLMTSIVEVSFEMELIMSSIPDDGQHVYESRPEDNERYDIKLHNAVQRELYRQRNCQCHMYFI